MKHLATILLIVCFNYSSYAQQGGFLWRVSGQELTEPSYLLGTLHILDHHYLEAQPAIMQAFHSSQAVVTEVIFDSVSIALAATESLLPAGSLRDFLDSTDYAQVDAEIKNLIGVPLDMLASMKPMAVTTLLALTYYQVAIPELAQLTGEPMDKWLQDEAVRTGKQSLALETIQEQMQMLFDGQPYQEQADGLVEIVAEKELMIQLSKAMYDAYLASNLEALGQTAYSTPESETLMAALLDVRNLAWLEKLPAIMKNQSTFIAVGALHLHGEKGLIQLLRNQGYTVESF